MACSQMSLRSASVVHDTCARITSSSSGPAVCGAR